MRDPLQVILDFALARAQEAEALFKEWSPRVDDPEIKALFAGLAAAERGRTEMLSRMIPEELTPGAAPAPDLTKLLVHVKAVRKPTLEQAIRVAIQRKGVTALLFARIAQLEGEACSFFCSMAEEDRRATCALKAYAERLATGE